MKIAADTAVSFHYHLTTSTCVVVDSSRGKSPMAYLHGHNQLVAGLERAHLGQETGAKLHVEVPAEDGYGQHDPALDISIPISTFPPHTHARLQPGARFEGPHPADPTQPVMFTVVDVVGTELRCSGNHPLAGTTLHFEVEVTEVRPATDLELRQVRVLPRGASESSGCCSDPSCCS